MSFWQFINSGIGKTNDKLLIRFIYADAIISAVAAAIAGSAAGFIFDGNLLAIIISAAAAIACVYLIAYLIFIKKSRDS